jgi:hypothetical protein
VWLALLAMAGLALGPSISRALAPAARSAAVGHEHHMAMGAHAAMMAGGHAEHGRTSDAPVDSSCVLDCCALCAVAASPFTGVAGFVALCLQSEGTAFAQADRSRARPGEREIWSSATPRGPPVST